MKVEELNAIMESIVFDEIKKSILNESMGGVMEKYHVTCEGEPVVNCDTQEEAEEHINKLEKEHPGKQFIIEKAKYDSHDDMIEKLDKMGEELEETENMKKFETKEGNAFTGAMTKAKESGEKTFTVDGKEFDVEEELKGGQKKLDKNHNGKIDAQDFKILKGQKQDTKEEKEEETCEQCGSDNINEDWGSSDQGYMNKRIHRDLGEPTSFPFDLEAVQNAAAEAVDDHWDEWEEYENDRDGLIDYAVRLYYRAYFKDTFEKMEQMFAPKQDNTQDEMNEMMDTCNECGGMMNEEGMCTECSGNMMESKKKTLRLTESELVKLIGKMVSEAAVPGIETQKKVRSASGKENDTNLNDVKKKIKGQLEIPGGTNPEFPEANKKGEKVVTNNTEKEDEFVSNFRGGTLLDLDYDNEPSEQFNARVKKALDGDTTMGNSHNAANVIATDTGKKLVDRAKKKEAEQEKAPMYKKDPGPKDRIDESEKLKTNLINEDIEKMKKMFGYNKKTQ
jgi:hypothetical protein